MAGTQLVVCAQPQALQSLCAQRELGPALELPLRRRDVELSPALIDQLHWQRLRPFEKLADMLLNHPEGHFKLLPHQSAMGGMVGHQRKQDRKSTRLNSSHVE